MRERFAELMQKTPEAAHLDWEKIEAHLREVYERSALFGELGKQTGKRTGVFPDIDNTFYHREHEDAARELTGLATERHYPLVAVTGVDFEGVRRRIDSGELPPFAAILGAVGTELWVRQEQGGRPVYKKDLFFEKLLQETGYDRPRLAEASATMIGELRQSHPDWRLDFQEPAREAAYRADHQEAHQPFKISFHFFASPDELEAVSTELHKRFPDQYIVICEEINHNRTLPPGAAVKKYCIDILPIGKGEGVRYLQKLTGVQEGVVAGDSGNDLSMLTESGTLNAVLVGGYKVEAKKGLDAVIKSPKPGKRSFQWIEDENGKRAVYIETGKRIAAESMVRAGAILERAQRMKR